MAVAFFAVAFLAGAASRLVPSWEADFLAAVFLAVVLAELEDTNYLSIVVQELFRKLRGRDKTRTCQQPHGTLWHAHQGEAPAAVHARAAAFFSFL